MTSSIPFALAIAASPFAIMPAIMLLFTPRPRASAGAFLLAWFAGVAAVTALAVVFADVAEHEASSPAWLLRVRIALAVVIAALAFRTWRARLKPTAPPAWMAAISSAGPRKALGLGVVLSLANPKVIALAVAGGATIGAQPVPYGREAVHVIVFAALASLTVALPLLAHLAAGQRAVPALERIRTWLDRNAAAITAIVLAVIAVALGAGGVLGLIAG